MREAGRERELWERKGSAVEKEKRLRRRKRRPFEEEEAMVE